METQLCRICNVEKEIKDFSPNYRYKSGYSSVCKYCSSLDQSKRRKTEDWQNKNYLRKYGISLEERKALGNRCMICSKETGKLCVDHDHTTGKVRGLLCDNCNKGLGLFQDLPVLLEKAINYLYKYGYKDNLA